MTEKSVLDLWRTVKGALLSQTEREWLKNAASFIAEAFGSPLLLNIGVYHGASMHCLRAGAPDAILVGIDVATREIQGSDILRAEFIWRDSRRVAWDRSIHLLFVDGGHARNVVQSDIERFGKHVVAGGVVAFHDYDRSEAYFRERTQQHPKRAPLGIQRAVDEICTEDRGWEVLAMVDSVKAFRRRE